MKRVRKTFWASALAALLFKPWLTICDTDLDVEYPDDEEVAA